MHNFDDDENEKMSESTGRWDEFECPDCNAHNPVDDGFKVGDEVLCCYCGVEFNVRASGTKFKLKEA